MNQIAIINPRSATEDDFVGCTFRNTARAVVLDSENRVALMHVARDDYYKLPGGGIDEGEDIIEGLRRECQEEIGCDIDVVDEVGSTLEYWKEQNEKQTSYCYFARVLGEKGVPNFTESEKKRGFEVIWLPFTEALERIRGSRIDNYVPEYIVPRDIVFLETAEKFTV
jgi:8-oxo-dGTP diphosphatase